MKKLWLPPHLKSLSPHVANGDKVWQRWSRLIFLSRHFWLENAQWRFKNMETSSLDSSTLNLRQKKSSILLVLTLLWNQKEKNGFYILQWIKTSTLIFRVSKYETYLKCNMTIFFIKQMIKRISGLYSGCL